MLTANIRRSIIRLMGIVAIMTALVMSSGMASAMNSRIGLTECNEDACAVVTMDDLKAAQVERDVAVYQPFVFLYGPLDAQFTR